MEKQYFIRSGWRLNPKNKLDETLQEKFSEFNNTIIPESKLDSLRALHEATHADYYAGKGRCQAFKYSDSRQYHRHTETSDITVNVTDTFRIELYFIRESKFKEDPPAKEPFLTADNIPDDIKLYDIQRHISENIFLHYMELEDYKEDDDENIIDRTWQFSAKMYDCHYSFTVSQRDLEHRCGFILCEGESKLFESFEDAIQDDYWPLIVALCKKSIEYEKMEDGK